MKEGKKKRNPIGRPPKMTPETIDKLCQAFALGCTDKEACLYADISQGLLYKYQTKHPDFLERKERLKEAPVLKARQTVIRSIEKGDDVSARWYLERRKPEEFRQSHDVSVTASGSLSIEDREEALRDFLSRFE